MFGPALAELEEYDMEYRKTTRREALALLGVAGVAVGVGCGGEGGATSPSATPTATPGPDGASCAEAPAETIGPYPSLADLVRSDIREDRTGLPVTLTITVVNANSACSPVMGAVVDIGNATRKGATRSTPSRVTTGGATHSCAGSRRPTLPGA